MPGCRPADRLPLFPGVQAPLSAKCIFLPRTDSPAVFLADGPCLRGGCDAPCRRNAFVSPQVPRDLPAGSRFWPQGSSRALLWVSRPLPVGRPGDRSPRLSEHRVLGSRGRVSGCVRMAPGCVCPSSPRPAPVPCCPVMPHAYTAASSSLHRPHACAWTGVRAQVCAHVCLSACIRVCVKRATFDKFWRPRAAASAELLFLGRPHP